MVTEADRACEALIRELLREARPDDAFLGEEESEEAGTLRGPLGRRPDRRHRQLPLRPPAVRRLDRRRAATARSWPGSSSTPPPAPSTSAHVGRRRRRPWRPGTASRSAYAPRRRCPSAWWPPASATTRRQREIQARALVRLLPRVRDIRRLGSCALDLCHVAEGVGRRLRRGGREPLGPRRRRRWSPGPPAPGPSSPPGAGGRDLLRVRPVTRVRRVPRGGPPGGVPGSAGPGFRGNSGPVTDVHATRRGTVCAITSGWCTIWRRRRGQRRTC